MGFSPRSPRLIRGGIVLADAATGIVQRVIALQYNPDTITRSFQVRGVGGDSSEFSESLRLRGPAVETIKLEAEIDATDRMETGAPDPLSRSLTAQIAQLEGLVNPSAATLRANAAQAAAGSIEIVAMQTPLTLFVWSKSRVVPVRITELSVTEEAFDVELNPLRAKVNLGLRILSVDDVGAQSRAGALFLANLERKEQFAATLAGAPLSTLGLTSI